MFRLACNWGFQFVTIRISLGSQQSADNYDSLSLFPPSWNIAEYFCVSADFLIGIYWIRYLLPAVLTRETRETRQSQKMFFFEFDSQLH